MPFPTSVVKSDYHCNLIMAKLGGNFKILTPVSGDDEKREAALPGRLLPKDGGDVRQEVRRGEYSFI